MICSNIYNNNNLNKNVTHDYHNDSNTNLLQLMILNIVMLFRTLWSMDSVTIHGEVYLLIACYRTDAGCTGNVEVYHVTDLGITSLQVISAISINPRFYKASDGSVYLSISVW